MLNVYTFMLDGGNFITDTLKSNPRTVSFRISFFCGVCMGQPNKYLVNNKVKKRIIEEGRGRLKGCLTSNKEAWQLKHNEILFLQVSVTQHKDIDRQKKNRQTD